MSLRGQAAVVAVAELPNRREAPGRTHLDLLAEAARLALDDAGLEPGQVDGLLVGVQVGETPQHVAVTVAEYLGLQVSYADVVDLGGASGPGMVWRAAAAIGAGLCTTVLCVLAAARDGAVPAPRSPNRNPIREFDVPHGASGANTSYALIAQRYLHEFGRRPEDLALVPVVERANGHLNPHAVFRGRELTVDDVLASPLVAEPLHLLDIVMPVAGGTAVVVTSTARAGRFPQRPVLLRGAGERVTHRAVSGASTLTSTPLREAIGAACAMAAVRPDEVDVLALYDCYSILVLLTLEDAGLCAPGTAADWIADRDLSHRGEVSLNPHGGQLACGQADLSGGMSHLVEAVHQLRGTAGERQMADPRLALVTGNGATAGEEVALVLEAGP